MLYRLIKMYFYKVLSELALHFCIKETQIIQKCIINHLSEGAVEAGFYGQFRCKLGNRMLCIYAPG